MLMILKKVKNSELSKSFCYRYYGGIMTQLNRAYLFRRLKDLMLNIQKDVQSKSWMI